MSSVQPVQNTITPEMRTLIKRIKGTPSSIITKAYLNGSEVPKDTEITHFLGTNFSTSA